jgi:hypothetical protein
MELNYVSTERRDTCRWIQTEDVRVTQVLLGQKKAGRNSALHPAPRSAGRASLLWSSYSQPPIACNAETNSAASHPVAPRWGSLADFGHRMFARFAPSRLHVKLLRNLSRFRWHPRRSNLLAQKDDDSERARPARKRSFPLRCVRRQRPGLAFPRLRTLIRSIEKPNGQRHPRGI